MGYVALFFLIVFFYTIYSACMDNKKAIQREKDEKEKQLSAKERQESIMADRISGNRPDPIDRMREGNF